MKKLLISLFTGVFVALTACSGGSDNSVAENDFNISDNNISVFYFHFTNRCEGCISIENATKRVLEEEYADEIENESVVYYTVNLSESNSREIAQRLGVGGQGLIIVKGESKRDLTMDGFAYASADYERFKELFTEAMEEVNI